MATRNGAERSASRADRRRGEEMTDEVTSAVHDDAARPRMSDAAPKTGRPVNRLMKLAIAAGSESAVRLHISRGDDLDWRDERGFTPLMIAASRGRDIVCRLLLEAGVDLRATDAAGRDALTIAREAGASAAAEIIASFFDASAAEPADEAAVVPIERSAPILAEDAAPTGDAGATPPPDQPSEPEDYGDWEAEDERPAPAHDPTPIREQSALQRAISDHVPIDDSADWDDIEAYLPEMAAPLARAENAEFQAELRSIILRAVREGSVPSHAIEELYSSSRRDEARDVEAEGALARFLNDLGAEVDERFEYASNGDDFRVGPGTDETWDESDEVDEAMAALASLTERPKDPLRMQRRETQRINLLTPEEEVQLAQAMDAAADAALDAVAAWPAGLAALARVVDDVREGRRLISQIAASDQDESNPAESQVDPADAPAPTSVRDGEGELGDESADQESAPIASDAMERLERLRALAPEDGGQWPNAKIVRQALGAVGFRRSFLAEQADLELADRSANAKAFRDAIAELRKHRDRMTVANLRLVFPIARKYLFSEVPLEDLCQEGNIGLLKAVDRFDWRRGFRFSTMATWWVRQAVSRSIADSALAIRLPVHIHEVASRFKWEIEALEKALGREPTSAELAARVGMREEKIELLTRCLSEPLPLESPERERELHLQDKGDAFAEAETRAVSKTMTRAVEALGKKEASIIKLRFGLEGVEPRTLEEIGFIHRVTRERIRQIEAKAMRALAHPARLASLARALGIPDPPDSDEPPSGAAASFDEATQSEPPSLPSAAAPHAPAPPAEQATRVEAEAVGFGIDLGSEPYPELTEIVRQAERQGIRSLVSTSGGVKTTWVFLDQPRDVESTALAGSMLRMGFTYHPGKGFWK